MWYGRAEARAVRGTDAMTFAATVERNSLMARTHPRGCRFHVDESGTASFARPPDVYGHSDRPLMERIAVAANARLPSRPYRCGQVMLRNLSHWT